MLADVWDLLILPADFVSAACWVWMLCMLRWRVSSHRLFPRQLQSLGVVGLLLCISIPAIHLAHGSSLPSTWTPGFANLVLCQISYDAYRTLRIISVLQEAHLAAAFLAQSARWQKSLLVLNQTIPVVWASGVVLGVADSMLTKWDYDMVNNECVSTGFFGGVDVVSVGVICFCMGVSVLACLELCRSTWKTVPGSVRQRSFTRAVGYSLISVVSYLPTVVEYIQTDLFHNPPWYHPFAAVLQNCNGFLNVALAAYALRSCRRRRPMGEDAAATRVGLRGGVPRGQSVASVHVLFQGVDVELFDSVPFGTIVEEQGAGNPNLLEEGLPVVRVDDSNLRSTVLSQGGGAGAEEEVTVAAVRLSAVLASASSRVSAELQTQEISFEEIVTPKEMLTPEDLNQMQHQTSQAVQCHGSTTALFGNASFPSSSNGEGRSLKSKGKSRVRSRSKSAERGLSDISRAIQDLGF